MKDAMTLLGTSQATTCLIPAIINSLESFTRVSIFILLIAGEECNRLNKLRYVFGG